jgi:Calcineurin-like phosphoesterase
MFLAAAVLSAWVQYAADGKPHVRALAPQTCPAAVAYDGGSAPMRLRAGTAPGFDEVVCDAALPAHAQHVRLGEMHLPSPPAAPRTIVVLGDTGCRMSAYEQQNCGDIADWPFPKIAHTIAKVHADLLVHVGDYYYRETNCVASMTGCVNRWGDTSLSWNADWFWPGKPLFASAPLVMIRGNHEDCERGGPAWFRYLDGGDTVTPCTAGSVDGTLPWAVSFPGLRIVVNDSAADPSDSKPDPARIAFYEASYRKAQALAGGASADAWFVTHRPPYANTNETQALLHLNWTLAPFGAVLAGHVHDFEAINLTGYPSIVVNGESGDDLDDAGSTAKYIQLQTNDGKPVYTFATPAPYATKQFGFAVYTKTAAGWKISLRDVDGIERRACLLAKGGVACP